VRLFSRLLILVIFFGFIPGFWVPVYAAATEAPIITKIVQGTSGALTVHVAPQVEGSENTWFYQVVNNDAGCLNPYGNSATTSTSGAPASFSITGLSNGCKYEIRVANWNGSTSPYTSVYAIPGVSKTTSTCTSFAGNTTYLNVSPISGTTDCLVSVLEVSQSVQWIPTYGMSSVRFLAVGGGGAGSRGVCAIYWGAGGGGGVEIAQKFALYLGEVLTQHRTVCPQQLVQHQVVQM